MYQSMMCHPNQSSFFEPLQPQLPYFPSTIREKPRIGFEEQSYAPVYKSIKTESTSNRSRHFQGQPRDNSYENFITDAQFSDDEDNNVHHSRSNHYSPSQNGFVSQQYQQRQGNSYSQHPQRSHQRSSHHPYNHHSRPSDNRRRNNQNVRNERNERNDRRSHMHRQNQQQQPREERTDFLKNLHYDPDSIHKNESLKEIREFFEKSLKQKDVVNETKPAMLEKVDSFPRPTVTRDDSKTESNGSVLKALLSQVRLKNPTSIKEKYMRKVNQEGLLDLSTIVYK